jgi:hypothetical protein
MVDVESTATLAAPEKPGFDQMVLQASLAVSCSH